MDDQVEKLQTDYKETQNEDAKSATKRRTAKRPEKETVHGAAKEICRDTGMQKIIDRDKMKTTSN